MASTDRNRRCPWRQCYASARRCRPRRRSKVSRLMAPPSACPGQRDADAPVGVQERAMRCMTNYARMRAGRGASIGPPVARRSRRRSSPATSSAATASATRPAAATSPTGSNAARTTSGGCWRAGENIAWGSGPYGTVRSIFRAWMHSAGHRANILSRRFDQFGVGLDVGGLDGSPPGPRLDHSTSATTAELGARRWPPRSIRTVRPCPRPSTSPTATASLVDRADPRSLGPRDPARRAARRPCSAARSRAGGRGASRSAGSPSRSCARSRSAPLRREARGGPPGPAGADWSRRR